MKILKNITERYNQIEERGNKKKNGWKVVKKYRIYLILLFY